MKLRKGEWLLLSLFLVFLVFSAGYFLGGRERAEEISVYLERSGEELPAAQNPEESPLMLPDAFEAPELININTATREELMFLPGIGEKRADDIIAYREANGPFEKNEDLLNVSGIGEKVLSDISGRITLE